MRPEKIGNQARGRQGVMRELKRQLKRLIRRESKKINDPETETHPRRRFLGWW